MQPLLVLCCTKFEPEDDFYLAKEWDGPVWWNKTTVLTVSPELQTQRDFWVTQNIFKVGIWKHIGEASALHCRTRDSCRWWLWFRCVSKCRMMKGRKKKSNLKTNKQTSKKKKALCDLPQWEPILHLAAPQQQQRRLRVFSSRSLIWSANMFEYVMQLPFRRASEKLINQRR